MREADDLDVHVGGRLRLRRSLMGLSQERLGAMLGVTFQQIQKYERGASRVASDRLASLAGILGVPVAWFFEEFEADAERGLQQPGVAEDGADFITGPPGRKSQPFRAPLVDRRETLELVRAFNDILDPVLRRRIYELTKALAHATVSQVCSD